MASEQEHQLAFSLWTEHKGSKIHDTDTVVHELLRKAYPQHHVTRTSASKSDLMGFAKAGHAYTQPIFDNDFDATRVFRSPPTRLENEAGKLEDVVNFASHEYKWQNNAFIVYELFYVNNFAQYVKNLYILSPKSPNQMQDGHHLATDSLLLASGEWTSETHAQIWVFDNAKWDKSTSLFEGVQQTSWDDVIVDSQKKTKLSRDIHGFFDNRKLYQRSKIPWKRGIIFHGVPGNGKTLFTKAIINSLSRRSPPIPALYVKSLDACTGPKWSLQQIFQKARRTAPCLLVLEDLDSLVGDDTRSYFLNEVDGLSSNDGILMIGSTNHLDRLDPAVTKRPSRFDRKYHFDVPNEAERLAYCRYWRGLFTESEAVAFPDEMCAVIAALTEGLSFAYLKELFVCSLLLITRSKHGEADGIDEPDEPEEPSPPQEPELPVENGVKESHSDTAGSSTDEAKAAEKEKKKVKPKRSLPHVDVPPSLQDNKLLRTIKSQARQMLEDMDHEAEMADKQPNKPTRPLPIQFRLPDPLGDDPL